MEPALASKIYLCPSRIPSRPRGTDEHVITGLREGQKRKQAGSILLSEMVLPAQGAWLNALEAVVKPHRPTIQQAERLETDKGQDRLLDYLQSNTPRVQSHRLRSDVDSRLEPTPLYKDPRIEEYMGARWWPDRDQQTPMSEFNLSPAQLGKAEARVWIHEDWEKRKERYKSYSRTTALPLTGIVATA